MIPRHAAGAMLAGIALLAPRAAPAEESGRGAVIVAVGDEAGPAARPLAKEIYGDLAMRPALDDASARVLIGEPLPESPSAFVKELAETRAAVAVATSDVAARRLLASLGTDARAAAVVAVTLRDGKVVARVLRLPAGTFESVELVATIEPGEPPTYSWPGAAKALRGLLQPAAPAAAARPAPAAEAAAPKKKAGSTSMFTSPWFWGGLGAVATVGVTVFVIGNAAQNDDPLLRIQGRVAP